MSTIAKSIQLWRWMTRMVVLFGFVFTMVWIFEPTHLTRSSSFSFAAFVVCFLWTIVCHNKIWTLHLQAQTLADRLTIYEAIPEIDTQPVTATARV